YSGAPTAIINSCVLPASSCVTGTFNLGSFSAGNGVATSTTANYTEAGAVSLILSDSSYASVDGPAIDGTPDSQLTISSSAVTVGRFVPDHFDLILNTPSFTPGCGTFTYFGQPIMYAVNPVVTVTAKNAAGNITQNYGSLFNIVPTSGSFGITPSYTEPNYSVSVQNAAAPAVTNNGGGNATLTFANTTSNILSLARPTNPVSSYPANLVMSFTMQDTDGVTVGNVGGVSAVNPVQFGSSGAGIAFTNLYNAFQWGRLALTNVNGSELFPLNMGITAQYYSGYGFVTNKSDNCTTLNLSSMFSLTNPGTNSGAAQNGAATMNVGSGTSSASLSGATLASGQANLIFSSPGAGNTGYISVISSFSAALPWLLYNWNQAGAGNTSPTAIATFGEYSTSPLIIYMHEMY
ncbi:MAG: DUF6701 domain-containing protein, partial [Methylomonas sp.]